MQRVNSSVIVLFGLLVAISAPGGLAEAQDVDRARLYLYYGQTPFAMEAGYYEIQLNSAADKSPVPSSVDLNQLGMSKANQIGLGLQWAESRAAIEADWKFEGGFSAVGASGLWRPATPLAGRLIGFLRFGLSGSYVWGEIGEVGSQSGDVYLIAPDGEQYNAGAKLNVWGLAFGGDSGVGLGYRLASGAEILLSAGYRFLSPIEADGWRYRVEDGDRASDLPQAGFDEAPPTLDQAGPMFQLTFVFGIGGEP